MSQRYPAGVAHERMEAGRCPECGNKVAAHLADPRFWVPRECDLTWPGVVDRIEQYRADKTAVAP